MSGVIIAAAKQASRPGRPGTCSGRDQLKVLAMSVSKTQTAPGGGGQQKAGAAWGSDTLLLIWLACGQSPSVRVQVTHNREYRWADSRSEMRQVEHHVGVKQTVLCSGGVNGFDVAPRAHSVLRQQKGTAPVDKLFG
ncbi:hypothetical protein EYF80_020112 [Liparis tanakae]|uniref:Uncharacterized protein n=1 Tax=Liparis tanakae TaxID=230148 RepID=A0A4Z2HXH2_9TELE|nr:hypothetical protein EYF80_020112 [Liparis tanakae]